MTIQRFDTIEGLRAASVFARFERFLNDDGQAHFFQGPECIEFIQPVNGFRPVLFIALDEHGKVMGSLLGVYQREGTGIKSWMSRRALVIGGPLGDPSATSPLLQALVNDAAGNAIFVEFRNTFDTAQRQATFERHGFTFRPHLNFLLDVNSEEEALKTLSGTRRREIKGSVAAGATYGEATDQYEVEGFYRILSALYREKVRKPLPGIDLFLRLHASPNGRVFVVRHGGRVIGGSAGPVYKDRIIYYWYACGDNTIKGVHASVLATWAPIEHAARNGIRVLDLMGAGKPGQGYGVHDFKARFGGTEVAFGRYGKVLNRPLFLIATSMLKVYQGAMAFAGGIRNRRPAGGKPNRRTMNAEPQKWISAGLSHASDQRPAVLRSH